MALLQDAISSGEVTPRKLIISGLLYDSPLTIEGGAEAHAAEAIAIHNVHDQELRLDDFMLVDPNSGDSTQLPLISLQPGSTAILARAGSSLRNNELISLLGIDTTALSGQYVVQQLSTLLDFPDAGGEVVLARLEENQWHVEDALEYGLADSLQAPNAYQSSAPQALHRHAFLRGH